MTQKKKELLRIAVFDIDRTLIQNTSAEVQLIHFLRSRRLLPLSNFARLIVNMLRKVPSGFHQFIFGKSTYLYGLKVETIKDLLPQFFEERIRPRLSTRLLEIIGKLKNIRP